MLVLVLFLQEVIAMGVFLCFVYVLVRSKTEKHHLLIPIQFLKIEKRNRKSSYTFKHVLGSKSKSHCILQLSQSRSKKAHLIIMMISKRPKKEHSISVSKKPLQSIHELGVLAICEVQPFLVL